MYRPEQWQEFFVMVGGGSAALTGLVFVAMSLNLEPITRDATHRHRAVGTLAGFAAAFVICALALMELQASRLGARIGPDGEPVLLSDQDRTRWDRLLIRRGLAALERASRLGRGLGPYGLQAAIAACHATAASTENTDWVRIAALYDALGEVAPSPVVELNRAVAVSMAYGPDAGLAVLEAVAGHPAMSNYYLFLSVRGDLLERLGRFADAEAAFRQASETTGNERERTLLRDRAIGSGRRIPPQGCRACSRSFATGTDLPA